MEQQDGSRLTLELELLKAIYPDQVAWNGRSRELKFTDGSALLQLRLPESYPDAGFPDVISGRDAAKNDLRDQTKAAVQAAMLADGEEALDAVIACFLDVVETNSSDSAADTSEASGVHASRPEASKTVIIWLHHLLALTKRKLALSPPLLSGVTKPGYPGIMIFSGPASAIAEHVNRLKAENWQAFQVRYEGDELWIFAHGVGICEVETMAEVVKAVEAGAPGREQKQKQEFLQAVGIK
ncbi:hypothetical protein P280DRAFT_395185 [Massarina eburnea CBS 473.64]|uniref:RWD domain-containing protein n=1 Tax=Massarina eburnea CBS 473.64 TaxID=1395130 RepID=A0A6A6S604_9PLEO|nr:hypothetical protein P280DRAFT_395185 [Massarina eburnea CBS 473.64]